MHYYYLLFISHSLLAAVAIAHLNSHTRTITRTHTKAHTYSDTNQSSNNLKQLHSNAQCYTKNIHSHIQSIRWYYTITSNEIHLHFISTQWQNKETEENERANETKWTLTNIESNTTEMIDIFLFIWTTKLFAHFVEREMMWENLDFNLYMTSDANGSHQLKINNDEFFSSIIQDHFVQIKYNADTHSHTHSCNAHNTHNDMQIHWPLGI